jgi:hypothetical protein
MMTVEAMVTEAKTMATKVVVALALAMMLHLNDHWSTFLLHSIESMSMTTTPVDNELDQMATNDFSANTLALTKHRLSTMKKARHVQSVDHVIHEEIQWAHLALSLMFQFDLSNVEIPWLTNKQTNK